MNQKAIRELLLFFVFIILTLPNFWHGDLFCWRGWALSINTSGIGNIYRTDANYPPLLMYLLSFFNFLEGTNANVTKNMNYFKVITLVFDFLPLVLFFVFRKVHELKNRHYFFLLFNIAYLYNTIIWGQLDAIPSALAIIAVFVALRYPTLAMVMYVLALNMKLQAIIFFPVLVLCLATKLSSVKSTLKGILVSLLVQVVLLIPFMRAHTLKKLWAVVLDSGGYYPYASMNGFNLWHLVLKGNPSTIWDTDKAFGLSYKFIGFALFLIVSGVTLFPLIVKTIRTMVVKVRPRNYQELMFLSTGMIAIVFFFFNTEMHERYSHPAMIFLFFYSTYRRKFGLYILVSVAYLLNVEKVLGYYSSIAHHTAIFEPKFIASLFLLALVIGITNIYKNYAVMDDIRLLRASFRNRRSNKHTISAVA